ncbi:MAG TPA: serine/threonine-protein kinase [Kofleriaceae bacterium]|nr:serine/threonine-protein kinase [Kofleriaceae bacterium]
MPVVDRQLAVIDPSGRLLAELEPLAAAAQLGCVTAPPGAPPADHADCAAVLIAPALAADLGLAPPGAPPRWIVGNAGDPARLAGAAAQAGAAGVLLTPLSVAALAACVQLPAPAPELDLARARGLVSTSLVELAGNASDILRAIAGGFGAEDCIVWSLDGSQLVPSLARRRPDDAYRTEIAGAARIAAAAAGTVITGGPQPRAVIAGALGPAAAEVGGLIAIVADPPRRFSAAERADLTALAIRLTRELPWLASHRFVADAELPRVASDGRSPRHPGAQAGGLATGTILGGTYRVVHELSRGAMGVVYRGEDLGLGRPVAIKVLRPDLASDRDLVARFRAEAGLLASLHHPNLVQVYALGEHAGEVYFVMELVEGQPLSEVLRATFERSEWFPTAAIAQIALEIGDALDAMHAIGVIHRDVKPANVLLDRERDRAVLVDVGVAVKAGDQRDAAGTPGFAAPESFLDQADAPTTDVYGLAATVYCMLAGRPPFGAGPASQVVQRQLGDPLTPPSQLRPSLTEAIDAVIAKALSPVPKKRWASASTFSIALARALDRLPTSDSSLVQELEDPIRAAELLLGPTEGLDSVGSFGLLPPPPRVITGHVRAAHLRVLSRLLQHHIGEAGFAQLIADTPALADALASELAPLGWVALGDLVAALALTRSHVPSQLVPRKIGRGTMSATFARLFGANPAALTPDEAAAALPAFWSRYHDWGDVEVELADGRAHVVLHGYAGSADVCTLVAAELERVIELTGAAGVGVSHPACVFTGARRCEYRVVWKAAPRG